MTRPPSPKAVDPNRRHHPPDPNWTEPWTDQRGCLHTRAIPDQHSAPYWCVGPTKKGTISASDKVDALELFRIITGEGATACDILPYGASGTALNVIHYANGSTSGGGFFCFSPSECKGRTSCPKRYACSE